MDFKPYSYQQQIIDWIIDKPYCGLFLEMRMGKTICTLTALNILKYDRFEVDKILIIAPLNVAKVTWSDEVKKWEHISHLTVSKIIGTEKEREQAIKEDTDIYLINRDNVDWLVTKHLKNWKFDTLVIDESSSFKSSNSKRFRALKKVRKKLKRVIELTGTPTPNSLMELWPQIYLLDQGERLGKTLTSYKDSYFKPGRRNGHIIYEWILKEGAEKEIYEKINDICISLKAENNVQLTDRTYKTVEVELDEVALGMYRRLEKDRITEMTSAVVAVNAAVLANKLLQIANGAVYDENKSVIEVHDFKLKALEELINIKLDGKSVLIFYNFQHDVNRIKNIYPDAREIKKAEDIKDWNNRKIKIALAHPASVGHGLNLQYGGNIIVWFGLTWSLELYQQANARLHRPGQEEDVEIYHLVAKDTIDEKVMYVLSQKEVTQEALIEALRLRIKEIRKEGRES